MKTFLQGMFDLSPYKTQTEREKALFIYIVMLISFIIASIYIILIPDVGEGGSQTVLQDALGGGLVSIITIIFFYAAIGITFGLNRAGNMQIAGVGVPTMIYAIGIFPVLLGSRNMVQPEVPIIFAIIILVGGFIYLEQGVVATLSVSLVTLWLNHDPLLFADVPVITLILIGFAFIVYAYIRYAEATRSEGAETAVQERIRLADITMQISGLTLTRTDINNVLQQGLNLIQEGYPQFYHAQVFLTDKSGRNARLVSSTGEAGRALIQRQHSIGVGTQSVIGQATLRNVHVISRTTDENTVHQRNEFLPDTVLEIAFPLRVGEQVIGALDLQSKHNIQLSDDEIFTYQSLANSFALAIDNVRQFESAEERIKDNQKLAEQARQALREVDRLNKRLMEQAWSEYMMSQSEQPGLNIDFETDTIEEGRTWSDSLKQAMEDGNVIQTTNADNRLIAIPLRVRGQVIGAMEFELDEESTIDPTDLTLIQEVSERFGLAAENTRLVEDSQRVAQREALINEIGSRLQTTNNVESTLTEAVRSLSNVLNASRVSIKLRESTGNPDNNGISS